MSKKLTGTTLMRKIGKIFARKRERAATLTASPEAALATVDQALLLAEKLPSPSKLRGAVTDLGTLGRLVRAWVRRDYRHVSRGTIVMALGALIYFLAPLDAIFDAIPALGLVDDALVLAWVISEIRAELADFRAWETAQTTPVA